MAHGLTPTPEIAHQATPGGGVILSAVCDRLDPANPEHIRRAALLEAILEERVGRSQFVNSVAPQTPARIGPY